MSGTECKLGTNIGNRSKWALQDEVSEKDLLVKSYQTTLHTLWFLNADVKAVKSGPK